MENNIPGSTPAIQRPHTAPSGYRKGRRGRKGRSVVDPRPGRGLVLLALLVWAPAARADVVGPSPTDCPSWTEPGTCHGGPHCRIDACVDSSSCKGGEVCQEHRICVVKIDCSGMKPTPTWVDTARGTCGGGAACENGGTCTTVKICLARGTLDDSDGGPTPERGCTCDVGEGLVSAPLCGALLLLLLLLARRARGHAR